MGPKVGKTRKLETICIGILFTMPLLVGMQAKSLGKSKNGCVVSNAPGCAQIGRDIMKRGGNVIDTVIATAFCEGVGNPTTMGIGGGFLATVYNRTTKEVWNIDAREYAPAGATEDMFVKNQSLAGKGGLSVAVPLEVKGFWFMYQKWGGGVPWKDLIEPTIKICEDGIEMNDLTERNIIKGIDIIKADPGLKAIFINPKTNEVYKTGEKYKRPKLAQTLRIIAKEGGDALNKGSLTKSLVKDIRDQGGIITEKDMITSQPKLEKSVYIKIKGKNIYSMELPGSGMILTYILNILEGFLDKTNIASVKNYQRIVEAMKYGYGIRGQLGDPNFVEGIPDLVKKVTSKSFAKQTREKIRDDFTSSDPKHYGSYEALMSDHGTANIAVWGPNGDGIALTSSINQILGAGFASSSTDIILNDSMDDFSTPGLTNEYGYPPSPSNYIAPGKKPLSSKCPTIITDERGDLYMVIGGAGGSRITSSVAQVIINRLYFNMDIKKASDMKRVHHQLYPMNLFLEDEWKTQDHDVALGLAKIGHNITYSKPDGFVAVTAISVDKNKKDIVGVHDKRRLGSVAYLNSV